MDTLELLKNEDDMSSEEKRISEKKLIMELNKLEKTYYKDKDIFLNNFQKASAILSNNYLDLLIKYFQTHEKNNLMQLIREYSNNNNIYYYITAAMITKAMTWIKENISLPGAVW